VKFPVKLTIKLTARTRLTMLFAALIAFSGAAVAVLVIVLVYTPTTTIVKPPVDKPVNKAALAQFELDVKAQARQEMISRLTMASAITIGTLTLVSAGLGWLLAGRVLRPVHVVSNTARRLSEQNLHERIPVTGPNDEMRELAETFNGMLGRLQRSFEAQSHFTANAAHELRGPMTTQRTLVEVAAGASDAGPDLRELATSLGPVLERQERLVDGLLALAWSEHGVTTVERVRLDTLVHSALARTDTDLTISAAVEESFVDGDPTLLDLMVDNLVRNAVQHNVPDGQIWISVSPGSMRIANTGAPITAARLATLAEPFRRGTQDRVNSNGIGLGLAIVTAVARAHNALIQVLPRTNGGISVSIQFLAPTPGPAAIPDAISDTMG
jgi:signal transduction histidine kinase